MPRTPPHFKVKLSVQNHAKMTAIYGDNDLFALWVRLGIKAIERFADRTADSFIVHDRELGSLTGKGRADVARRLLARLADLSPITSEPDGEVYVIHIPNLSKKHGFGKRNGTPKPPHADADADADADVVKEPPLFPQKGKPQKSKPAPRKPAVERATTFPEGGLTAEQKAELTASPSLKDISPSQFQHACQAVADWSTGDEKGPKRRVDWVAVVRNAINRGWALEGYGGGNRKATVGRGNTNYASPPVSSNWNG